MHPVQSLIVFLFLFIFSRMFRLKQNKRKENQKKKNCSMQRTKPIRMFTSRCSKLNWKWKWIWKISETCPLINVLPLVCCCSRFFFFYNIESQSARHSTSTSQAFFLIVFCIWNEKNTIASSLILMNIEDQFIRLRCLNIFVAFFIGIEARVNNALYSLLFSLYSFENIFFSSWKKKIIIFFKWKEKFAFFFIVVHNHYSLSIMSFKWIFLDCLFCSSFFTKLK